MNDEYIFWICIIVSIIGLAIIIGLILFGMVIMRVKLFKNINNEYFIDKFLFHWLDNNQNRLNNIPQHFENAYTEYLQRRNEFWTSYGQIIIAILIAIILCILLLTKSISAEAGLPILSAISGFAIAKGVSSSKSVNLPQEKRNNESK